MSKTSPSERQSRRMSLVEAIANVSIGYGIAVATQMLIFPWFGLQTTLAQNLQMGGLFTVVSIGRSYALRRLFEAVLVRSGATWISFLPRLARTARGEAPREGARGR